MDGCWLFGWHDRWPVPLLDRGAAFGGSPFFLCHPGLEPGSIGGLPGVSRVPSDSGRAAAWKPSARRPVSRVLYPACAGRWPFIWDARRRTPRATYPGGGAETRLAGRAGLPPLLGLAPGGVYRAVPVAGDAVRSYRTLSPLPADALASASGRFAFCGTVPGVAPAGRYPAPPFRGARTFLPRRGPKPETEGGHPAVWHLRCKERRRRTSRQGALRQVGGPVCL